jgi:hypothetical protein
MPWRLWLYGQGLRGGCGRAGGRFDVAGLKCRYRAVAYVVRSSPAASADPASRAALLKTSSCECGRRGGAELCTGGSRGRGGSGVGCVSLGVMWNFQLTGGRERPHGGCGSGQASRTCLLVGSISGLGAKPIDRDLGRSLVGGRWGTYESVPGLWTRGGTMVRKRRGIRL